MRKWDGYQRGINLGGWFSQCDYSKERYDNFIKEEDFKVISEWGLDHVRVPVDYNLVEDESGNYIEAGFEYIDRVVHWCGKYNLNMVLDLHKTYGFSFDAGEMETGFFFNEAYQERFYKLWEQFAKRYGKYSDRVAFELLNEVTDKEFISKWREISEKCIRRIRALAPDSYIVLGSYWNNHVCAVEDLQQPADDRIIYNFHCYDPLIFTHQGAPWVMGMDPDFRLSYDREYDVICSEQRKMFPDLWNGNLPLTLDGSKKIGPEFFEALFSGAIRTAEERNVPLYCGEYGVIEKADSEDILKWFTDINAVFEKYGIGRAAWSYRGMDFDIAGEHLKGVINELVKVF